MTRMLFSLMLCLLGISVAVAEDSRPNIVFILSDDQGWEDYGFMGHSDIKTPHLDKLASESLLFRRGYVAAPICRPSLASMITGLYPQQHDIISNDIQQNENRHKLDEVRREKFHRLPSFIRMLTDNGYLAHQSGKWWEGHWSDGGFTAGMTIGDPKKRGRHGDAGLVIGRQGLKPVTDFIDHAFQEKKPFFLWYAPFLPHSPHNPPQRLLKKYQQDGRAADVAKYYAMCEWFDETCGELVGYLDQKNIRDNTAVIYICDNGWAAPSTMASHSDQSRWKSYALKSKASPYELGIRSPVMIQWPGHLEAKDSPDLAHAIDLFPTIAAIAGLDAPANLPGINLLDEEARSNRDTVYGVTHSSHFAIPGQPHKTLQYLWCIHDNWKLLVRFHGKDVERHLALHDWDKEPVQLYDVVDDPHETKNLAEAHPEVTAKLKKMITTWYEATQP